MSDFTRIDRLNTALFYAILALLIWVLFLILSPFLQPLGWAAVLAILIKPWQRGLCRRWGNTRAALAATAAVTLLLIIPGILLTFYFVREGVQAAQQLQALASSGRLDWAARVWSSLASRVGMSNASLSSVLQDSAKTLAAFLAGSLAAIVTNLLRLILDLFLLLFALFFFLRDSGKIMGVVRRLLPFEEPLREKMLAETEQLIHASVTVTVVIALVQGSICGVAFAIVGINEPLFWTVLMSFLALLPIVGAWPVWVPAAIWMFASHQVGRGILLLVICGGVAGTVDNILRPLLMSGRSELNALIVFLAVLGGVAAFGMIGLVLGPIVFSMVLALLDVYTRRPEPQ